MLPGYPSDEHIMRRFAFDALQGVGDNARGQWQEWTGTYYHLRRRLSSKEQKQIGEAIDIRGTEEAIQRRSTVQCYLPAHMKTWTE
jgi:hypothetical protein